VLINAAAAIIDVVIIFANLTGAIAVEAFRKARLS
jgi:hypothetical protein